MDSQKMRNHILLTKKKKTLGNLGSQVFSQLPKKYFQDFCGSRFLDSGPETPRICA